MIIRKLENFCTVDDNFNPIFRVSSRDVYGKKPIEVGSYAGLLKAISIVSYYNRELHLLFRGQKKEYLDRSNKPMLRPSIFRNDHNRISLSETSYKARCESLLSYSRSLIKEICNLNDHEKKELKTRKHIMGTARLKKFEPLQWSILQHYGVCETPLLDTTQSLPIACSFALANQTSGCAYLYVIGVPYLTDSVSYSANEGLLTTRLLSACPPEARRPHLQEGYLAGSFPVTKEKPKNTADYDFRNRLIARFRIPNSEQFWDCGQTIIPLEHLMPESDFFLDIIKRVKTISTNPI